MFSVWRTSAFNIAKPQRYTPIKQKTQLINIIVLQLEYYILAYFHKAVVNLTTDPKWSTERHMVSVDSVITL